MPLLAFTSASGRKFKVNPRKRGSSRFTRASAEEGLKAQSAKWPAVQA